MWNVTDAFLAAAQGDHVRVSYVQIWDIVRRSPIATLPVVSGSVSGSLEQAIRRDFTATVVDPTGTYLPTSVTSIVGVYGTDVRVLSGIRYADGTEELVPCGVFRLTRVDVTEDERGVTMNLAGYDHGIIVQGDPATPLVIQGGSPEEAVRQMILHRYSYVEFDLGSSDWSLGTLVFDGADLWAEARRIMAESTGKDLAFGVTGVCEARSMQNDEATDRIIDYSSTAVSTITRSLDADEVVNGVIVKGNGSGSAGVRGEAWDDDRSSPTYRYGRFGQRPLVITTEVVNDAGQAELAARALFARHAGPQERITLSIIPNPAQREGDVIQAFRPSVGARGLFIVESYDLPLGAADGLMSLTARTMKGAGT